MRVTAYPDYLEKDLNAQGFRYQVINQGISGNTTKDGVDRLQDALQVKPVLVIVAFGGNDGLRGLPIASTTRESGSHGFDSAAGRRQGCAGRHNPAPKLRSGLHPAVQPDVQAVGRPNTMCRCCRFLLQGVYGVSGGMQADGIHATDEGNAQVAINLLPLITPLLKKS